jgi:hypothetical protein
MHARGEVPILCRLLAALFRSVINSVGDRTPRFVNLGPCIIVRCRVQCLRRTEE